MLDKSLKDEVRDLVAELSESRDPRRIAEMLPVAQSQRLLQLFRRTGERYRVAYTPSTDLGDLELAVDIEDLLNEDDQQRRMTRWRLADACRVAGDVPRAIEIVRELIGPLPAAGAPDAVPARERAALVCDLAWMLTHSGDLDGAVAEVQRWLVDPAGEMRTEYLPLLTERARIRVLQDRRGDARKDLDEFFRRFPAGAHGRLTHAEYARACALSGLLLSDEGKEEEAKAVWRQGLVEHWNGSPWRPRDLSRMRGLEMIRWDDTIALDAMLGSWTGEISAERARQRHEDVVPGSGLISGALRTLVLTAVTPDLHKHIVFNMYASKQGREIGRRLILRDVSLRENYLLPANLIFFEGVRYYYILSGLEIPGVDEIAFASCREVVDTFAKEQIDEDDLEDLATTWFGKRTFKRSEIERVLKKFPPRAGAHLSFVFGVKHKLDGKPSSARYFLETAAAGPAADPAVVDAARKVLAELPAEP